MLKIGLTAALCVLALPALAQQSPQPPHRATIEMVGVELAVSHLGDQVNRLLQDRELLLQRVAQLQQEGAARPSRRQWWTDFSLGRNPPVQE